MKLEHVALFTEDLDGMRAFFMHYFHAASNQMYHNPRTGLRTYFLSFGDGARLEIMSRPDVTESGGSNRIGYAHISFSVGGKSQVDRLTERLRNDGWTVLSGPRTTGDGCYESCVEGPDGCLIDIEE